MTKTRQDTLPQDHWNVEAMYPTYEAWEKALDAEEKSPWPQEIEKHRAHLGTSAKALHQLLDLYFSTRQRLERLYTYAHLRHDEDIAHDKHKTGYEKIQTLFHDFAQKTAWIEPQILALPQGHLQECLAAKDLATYHFFLEKLIRQRPHTLDAPREELLALASKPLHTAYKAFSALNHADLSFGTIADAQGKKHPLTHGQYGLYMRSYDRTLRENAFKTLHKQYSTHENTLAELLQGCVSVHHFEAKARNYPSCLEAALFPKDIDTSVYRNLIAAVREGLASLHRYMEFRKKSLGVDTLHLWDMYVPLVKDLPLTMSYEQAQEAVIASVAPLGKDYQDLLHKGLKKDRWVDRYENKNKRSGAYSSGCYDSFPYILMNYSGTLNDAFTLAHEAGHSMHSLLAHTHQPYPTSDYPIFVAEVASTFNEELLLQHLLAKEQDPATKRYLINQKVEDIRATLFRQTMFAEFELLIHELLEKGTPLTPALLKEAFCTLNQDYFGPNVHIDEEAFIEWARIPHFYYNFYVFQYATGISAALALAEKVLNGGEKERQDYLGFLQGGYSRYPLELLRQAGVDMASPAPIRSAIATFDRLVQELIATG